MATKRADGKIQKNNNIPGTGIRNTETHRSKNKKNTEGEFKSNITSNKKRGVKTYTRKELRTLAIIMQILSILLILMSALICMVVPVAGIAGIALGIFIFIIGKKYKNAANTSDNDNIELNNISRSH